MAEDAEAERGSETASAALDTAADADAAVGTGKLAAVNRALVARVAALEAAESDLANLVSATGVAAIFLDKRLRIRRFSPSAARLMRSGEAEIGRPLADVGLRVKDRALLADAHRVLRRHEPMEAEVVGADGRWYARRVSPYRTPDGTVSGAVISFTDITKLRRTVDELDREAARRWSLAELALGNEDLDVLLDRVAGDVSARIDAAFVEVQELVDEGSALVLRAGAGWAPGLMGQARTPRDPRLHAGYALSRRGPHVIADFAAEERFEPSPLLRDHNIAAGMVCSVGPAIGPWGLIGVYREDTRPFEEHEVAYLQAMANLLWLAVSQGRAREARDVERQELRQLIDGLPILIGVVDRNLRFEIANKSFEALGWIADELEGETVAEVIGAEAFAHGRSGFEAALDNMSTSFEIAIRRRELEPRVYLVHNEPRRTFGAVSGFFLAMIDITERKRVEERNAVISAELDHRVKNILALVTTIARMTGRSAESFEAFTEVFEDRIHSLARTHAALADTDWVGMGLRELLESELAAYVELVSERVTLAGPALTLPRGPTQSLALAFHEMVTNAVKYGAFSQAEGRLDVEWLWQEDGALALTWREDGLTGVGDVGGQGFGGQGFGRTVIESAVAEQLGGDVRFAMHESGICCTLVVPRRALVAEGGDG